MELHNVLAGTAPSFAAAHQTTPSLHFQDLQSQVPPGIVLHEASECEIYKPNRANSESMHLLMTSVECYIVVQQLDPTPGDAAAETGNNDAC